MSHIAHVTPAVSGVPGYFHNLVTSGRERAPYIYKTLAGKASKALLVSLVLCLSESLLGWYLATQVVARAAVGCVCFLGFVQVLPPNLALSEASRFAVWDLIL